MLKPESAAFDEARDDLELALIAIAGIAKTLLRLSEPAGDYSDILNFLGGQLMNERATAQEAMELLLFDGPSESAPAVVDAYPGVMFREAAAKLDQNDLVGAARCAHEAVRALEALFKYGAPGMAVAPEEAAQ